MQNFIKHKNWYRITRDKLKAKYKTNYKLFAGLIASTSPRFQIKRNINTSENIYNDYNKNKRKFLKYATNNKKKFIKKYKLLPAHYNNIIKTLKHNFKNPLTLGGLKVNSFYNNIIGNWEYVTLDIWMIRYFKYDKDYLTPKPYKYFTRIIRKLAEKNGLYPCELQAILWEKTRNQNGLRPSNFIKHI